MAEPHEPQMTGTKTCCHCDRDLPVLAFAVRKAASDGLQSWCRDCHAASSHKRFWDRKQKTAYGQPFWMGHEKD